MDLTKLSLDQRLAALYAAKMLLFTDKPKELVSRWQLERTPPFFDEVEYRAIRLYYRTLREVVSKIPSEHWYIEADKLLIDETGWEPITTLGFDSDQTF